MSIKQLKEFVNRGWVKVTCPICKTQLRCEPDGETVYCEKCKQIVTPHDSLVACGLI